MLNECTRKHEMKQNEIKMKKVYQQTKCAHTVHDIQSKTYEMAHNEKALMTDFL